MQLSELKEGQKARLTKIGGEGALRQHFLDMGLIPGIEITYVKAAPKKYRLLSRLMEKKQYGAVRFLMGLNSKVKHK